MHKFARSVPRNYSVLGGKLLSATTEGIPAKATSNSSSACKRRIQIQFVPFPFALDYRWTTMNSLEGSISE